MALATALVCVAGGLPAESAAAPRETENDGASLETSGAEAPAEDWPSTVRKIRWDNGEYSSNFRVTYARPDTALGTDGSLIPSNARRYGEQRLICPAPTPVPRRTSGVRQSRVWGGRWQSQGDCLVEVWNSTNSVQSIGIATDGNYPPDPTRTKTIGSLNAPNLFAGDVPNPDPLEKHAPLAMIVADGCVLAFCEVRDALSGLSQAVSVAYWDENVADTPGGGSEAAHGEMKWKLHRTGPIVQVGRRRGDGWMASGPWIPPGGMDEQTGKLVDFFVAFTDYRNNPGSSGGQLFLMRCHRTSPDAKWTLDPAILLYTDEPNGQLAALPGESNYMHFHSAAVTFPGGGVDGRRIVVTLSVGDGWPNNRMVNIARDDFEAYDDQGDSIDEPRAKNPTPGMFPPDSPTWDGWTTYEDREGQRSRIAFAKDDFGQFTTRFLSSPYRLQYMMEPNPFSGYTHPGGVTPLFFTGGEPGFYGTGAGGIIGKDNENELLLCNACAANSPTGMSGSLWGDRGVQSVYMFPTSDRSTFLTGGDETSIWMYRAKISDPSRRINFQNIMGVPTHSAAGYNGAGICLNWLCFIGAERLGQLRGDYAVTDYLALVRPNSASGWLNESAPQALCYSPDGIHWGEMYAPNYTSGDRSMQSAFYRQLEGSTPTDRVFVGRADASGLWAIKKPTPETTVLARPLQISMGGASAARVYAGPEGIPAMEPIVPPGGLNVSMPVNRKSFGAAGAYENVPPPPCEGPITRFQFVSSSQMGTWKLGTDIALSYRPSVKGRLWLYRMPAVDTGNPNDFPVNAAAKLSFFGAALKPSESLAETRLYQGPFIGAAGGSTVPAAGEVQGTGWTPFTFEVSPSGFGGASNYTFVAKFVSSNYEFNRQDVLVAVDYIAYADENGNADMPARSMKYGSAVPAQGDKLELLYSPASPNLEAGPVIRPWTVMTALTLPTAGPDAKTSHRSPSPDATPLFTLWAGTRSYLRVVFDREYSTIWVIDRMDNAWPLSGPGVGVDGVPFAQPFFAGRGRQVLFGLACYDAGGGKPGYRAWVSVGGTRVLYQSTTDLQLVTPNRIRLGDQNQQNADPADYFGFYVDDGKAMSEAEGRAALSDLSFLK